MRTQRFGIEIEMTYPLEYCPNCPQGSIVGALNLVSLMDCNIYDKYDEAFAYTGTTESIIPTTGSDAVWAPDVKYNEKLPAGSFYAKEVPMMRKSSLHADCPWR